MTIPGLMAQFEFQAAGLRIGYLPEPQIRKAIEAGQLVEKQVEEQRPAENFYLAWQTAERGVALNLYLSRLRGIDL